MVVKNTGKTKPAGKSNPQSKVNEKSTSKRPPWMDKESVDIPSESGSFFPRISLTQALSQAVDPGSKNYVKGAKPGDFVWSSSGGSQILGESFQCIVLGTTKHYTEWIPRKRGGGFVASYDSKEEMEAGYQQGNDISVSIDFLLLLIDGKEETDEATLAIMSFDTPTKHAVQRVWKKLIEENETLSGMVYEIRMRPARNAANQPYFSMDVDNVEWVPKTLYNSAQILWQEKQQLFLPAPESDDDIAI